MAFELIFIVLKKAKTEPDSIFLSLVGWYGNSDRARSEWSSLRSLHSLRALCSEHRLRILGPQSQML